MLGYLNTIDRALYQKCFFDERSLPKPFLTNQNWWKFILVFLVLNLATPILQSKGKIILLGRYDTYIDQVLTVGGLGCCVLIPILWVVQIKPAVIRKLGYYWLGSFEVINKLQVLNLFFVQIQPGRLNWVRVNRQLFGSLRLGDAVQVRKSCLGTLEQIQRVRFSYNKVSKKNSKQRTTSILPDHHRRAEQAISNKSVFSS